MKKVKNVIFRIIIFFLSVFMGFPAYCFAAESSQDPIEDVIIQEEIEFELLEEPEFGTDTEEVTEVDPETEEETTVQVTVEEDYSALIYAINESRDDIVRSVLFTGFLIVGCISAFIIWRFRV